MALTYLGDVGVYLPDKEVIQFTAMDGGRPVLCFVSRAALIKNGANPLADVVALLVYFEANRPQFESYVSRIFMREPSHAITVTPFDMDDIGRNSLN
jgi:hypothetical protein